MLREVPISKCRNDELRKSFSEYFAKRLIVAGRLLFTVGSLRSFRLSICRSLFSSRNTQLAIVWRMKRKKDGAKSTFDGTKIKGKGERCLRCLVSFEEDARDRITNLLTFARF